MAVILAEAIEQLNMEDDSPDLGELVLYVDAANEWVATKVTGTSAPSAVKLATLILVAHLWETQRGPASSPLAGDDQIVVAGWGYAIPNRVKELIAPDVGRATATGSFPDARAWPDAAEWC